MLYRILQHEAHPDLHCQTIFQTGKQLHSKNNLCLKICARKGEIFDYPGREMKVNDLFSRCISRSFASAEYTHIHTQINHFTSVAGDEALITWMNIRTRYESDLIS